MYSIRPWVILAITVISVTQTEVSDSTVPSFYNGLQMGEMKITKKEHRPEKKKSHLNDRGQIATALYCLYFLFSS